MTDLGTTIGSDAHRVREQGVPEQGVPAATATERGTAALPRATVATATLGRAEAESLPEPALVAPRETVVRIVASLLLVCGTSAGVGWACSGPSTALVAGLAPAIAAVVLYRWVVHPRLLRWGATPAEVSAVLPGDDLIESGVVTTRSVTIDAPVEQVWSWIVEFGFGPEGWLGRSWISPDLEHRRPGAPGLQTLRPPSAGCGEPDAFLFGAGFEVHRIELHRLLVSQAPDGTVWCLHLEDLGAGRTRLLSRFTSQPARHGGVAALSDPAVFVAERRMLLQLKARAESGAPVMQLVGPCAP